MCEILWFNIYKKIQTANHCLANKSHPVYSQSIERTEEVYSVVFQFQLQFTSKMYFLILSIYIHYLHQLHVITSSKRSIYWKRNIEYQYITRLWLTFLIFISNIKWFQILRISFDPWSSIVWSSVSINYCLLIVFWNYFYFILILI